MDHRDQELRRRHERFLSDGARPDIRSEVADSWLRSVAAGLDADHSAPPTVFEHDELVERRRAHPLAAVFPLLYDVLGRAAEDCQHVMAIGDEAGRLLWVCGDPAVLRKVEDIRFTAGAWWDEQHAGTNAPAMALRLDAPVRIRTAEHFSVPVQKWSCAATPIHHPDDGRLIGFVDVTGSRDAASPLSLAMVRSAARMAEAELGRLTLVERVTHSVAVPGAETMLTIQALGRVDCEIRIDGRPMRLSGRHSEILTALADEPTGLGAESLAWQVYGEVTQTSTLRAEIVRLRALLGAPVLESRPYRLTCPVDADWLRVERSLDSGQIQAALRSYGGPLLPMSEAPRIRERRTMLETRLRTAVLDCGEVDVLSVWTRCRWGIDDLEAWERLATLVPDSSPLAGRSRSEVDRLRAEYGAPDLRARPGTP